MKLYIAARFSAKGRLRVIAERLRNLGHQVVSEWIWIDGEDRELPLAAIRDYKNLHIAQCLLLDTTDPLDPDQSGGDREWEGGHATARNMTVILIGEKRHLFHHLIPIHFHTWDDLFNALEKGGGAFFWYLLNNLDTDDRTTRGKR